MNFNHYFNNDELEAALRNWAEMYPGLVELSAIGSSHECRPIWLFTITNLETGPDAEKPAIWLDGNIHATELAGTTTVLLLIHHLLENFGKDENITQLLNTSAVYCVPRINPDGAAAALDANPRFLRSGVRAYPWKDLENGLHVQDLDGDGRILQIRIPDPNGDWKPFEQDPRFMIKREPADFGGQYYRLFPEGMIENYDGYQINIARPSAGLDFNRNFPFEWRPENEQQGAGPYPGSEPEILAVVRFISNHPNINIALTFHTFSRALLRPYSNKPDDQMEPMDLSVYKLLGDIGTKITGYRCVSTYHDFTNSPRDLTTGAFDDWIYDHFGTFVFTVELWDLPTQAGIPDRRFTDWFNRHPVEEDLQIFQWVDENVGAHGYVSWYPFQHPQLGPVELGGWNTLFTWRNPPPALLQAEAERHLPYFLTLGRLLPHLTLHTLKVTPLEDQKWVIDLVVENNGYLPTYTSQQARKRRVIRPVMAEINLPETGKVILGQERMELGYLEGRSSKEDVTSVYASSPTDNRGHIQWLVECPAGSKVEVCVRSERAGLLRKTISLEK